VSLSEVFGTIDAVLGVLGGPKGSPAYIRFGAPPEGGLSARGVYDPYGRELREEGLSVFRAALAKPEEGEVYVVDCSTSVLEQSFRMYALEERRPVYLAEGREVGVGRAGEPLLGGDVRLTPLPVGTRVRSSGAADGRFAFQSFLARAELFAQTGGWARMPPRWKGGPAEEVVVTERAPDVGPVGPGGPEGGRS
jgi:hypothetical protein